jgi:para-aminobenzoate synthetase component 2
MAARYHSLAVDPATLPPELRVTAMSEVDRVVMGIRHTSLPLEGVQFHPESVLTPDGPHLLANFLRQAGEGEASRLDAAVGSFATQGLADDALPAAPEADAPIDTAAAAAAGAAR